MNENLMDEMDSDEVDDISTLTTITEGDIDADIPESDSTSLPLTREEKAAAAALELDNDRLPDPLEALGKVRPKQENEFCCVSCFLIISISRRSENSDICLDCY